MHIDDNGVVHFDAAEQAEFGREIEMPMLESLRHWFECAERLAVLLGDDWDGLTER